MTILVVSSWHERPDLLVDQIESYNHAFDGDLIQIFNINSSFEKEFALEAARLGIDFARYRNVYFPKYNVKTAWAMIAQSYLNGVLDSIMNGRRFEYVYFHTASDLMIKHGVNRHIKQHEIGFGNTPAHSYTLHNINGRISVDAQIEYAPFKIAMAKDTKLPDFLRSVDAKSIHASRAEGCFFRRDMFFEIMYPMNCFYNIQDLIEMQDAYPIEEYIFATCVAKFVSRNNVRRVRHVIQTSKNQFQLASVDDMLSVMKDPQLFGIKRFRAKLDDPERVYARKLLLQAPSPGSS